jgi:hypothetical protein
MSERKKCWTHTHDGSMCIFLHKRFEKLVCILTYPPPPPLMTFSTSHINQYLFPHIVVPFFTPLLPPFIYLTVAFSFYRSVHLTSFFFILYPPFPLNIFLFRICIGQWGRLKGLLINKKHGPEFLIVFQPYSSVGVGFIKKDPCL